MAAFNKINQFTEDLGKGVHNLLSNTFRLLYSNVAIDASKATKSLLTDITAGNGYTAGGPTLTITSFAQTSGVAKWIIADNVLTASGGSIGPFRYICIWNDTPTSPADPTIGWYDYGSAATINDTETFTVDFDGTNGVFTIT